MAEQHWRSVGGLVLPTPVAGHPALELVNTFSGWDGAHASDYLASYDHLAVLAGDLGLVDRADVAGLRAAAGRDDAAAGAALARARAVRAVVRAALLAPAAPALDALAEAARPGAATAVLVPGDPPAWRVLGHGSGDLDRPADAFAWSAAQLLTSPAAARVRACPGQGCGWTFLDVSGRRRWCSMAWCGNRAKVRAHAARQRPD